MWTYGKVRQNYRALLEIFEIILFYQYMNIIHKHQATWKSYTFHYH